VIGIELGSVFSRLGSQVTCIEFLGGIVGGIVLRWHCWYDSVYDSRASIITNAF
jgi:hypothetical protein